jgi:antitoxin (DNA-binding transcriptional repressor) of toxin-antitoxin stability system
MQTISATDLVRNLREKLDAVAITGDTLVIERNSIAVAMIVPAEKKMTARQTLAGMTIPVMTSEQAKAWHSDSREAFGEGLSDPWA